jgi:hypothetical protein
MPQHLWMNAGPFRMCEMCLAYQVERSGEFLPPVSTICSGDDDDGGARSRRRRRPSPRPCGHRVLDEAPA